MGDHVFISYSRADSAYAKALVAHLKDEKIDTWIDEGLELGDRWSVTIADKIDTCAAFVLIMTPAAERSDWVEREIVRAEEARKPILPLLLSGRPMLRVNNIQYEDVAGGIMPTPEFVGQLRARTAPAKVDAPPTGGDRIVFSVVEVDVTRVAKLRDQVKDAWHRRHGTKLSFLPFFLLAAIEALRIQPTLNAHIDARTSTVSYYEHQHLGIVVDAVQGEVVPVIRDAGRLNLAGLVRSVVTLADGVRSGTSSERAVTGATFTIVNSGSRGFLVEQPVVYAPQVATLGTGAVVKRAVVVADPNLGELIAVRTMAYLSLAYDSRLVHGADAARFLAAMRERLELGEFEADLGL